MGRLLRRLLRLPFAVLATYAAQQGARARRPDLSGATTDRVPTAPGRSRRRSSVR